MHRLAVNKYFTYYSVSFLQGVFLSLAISSSSKFAISLSINLVQHSISLETLAQHEYVVDSCQAFV